MPNHPQICERIPLGPGGWCEQSGLSVRFVRPSMVSASQIHQDVGPGGAL